MATESSPLYATTFAAPKFRALIADEHLASREAITRVLSEDHSIDVVSECTNGHDALEAIAQYAPDMLFVDVQLPEVPGFQVVESAEAKVPAVVFISAIDQYAARAFDAHAADYVVKPFHDARLQQAIERAKLRVQIERARVAFPNLHPDSEFALGVDGPRYLERLALRRGNRIFFQRVQSVDCFTSAANYVHVHCGAESHRMRSTMGELERQLDPKQFVRIHRCTIINIESLREFHPLPHGDYVVKLNDGREVTMSRNYRRRFREALERLSYTQ